MNKCFSFLKINFVFWLNHHTQPLPAGQKNCFYWDSDNEDRITKQQKKKRGIEISSKNWSIITFPCMMTASYLSLVRVQASNKKNMVICGLQRNAITFSSFCRLWVAIATVTLVIVIALRKTKTKNVPMECEMKKIKKHSKKMKMRHRRYNYHFWGLNGLPM